MKRIGIEVGNVKVTATLLEDKAPNAVQHMWAQLPVTAEMRHARRSGNAAYAVMHEAADAGLSVENQVSFCYPGSICLMPATGTLLFSYGQTQARTEDGNVWVTHLGTIEGDLKPFFAVLAERQRRGVEPITITREED